ncbi:MAG TPA: hypothetical protein VEV87_06450 [Chitinophagaceae bacterium]|nr:hypothetical protein [Chitinophagaceae bacterium]
MTTQLLKPSLSAGIGCLLAIPAAYFLLINILNEIGLPGLYNLSEPLLESLGLSKGIGLNINLLIVFGPLIALLLNVTSVMKVDWEGSGTELKFHINILKKWSNWIIIGLSGLCLLILFFYLLGENCK